MKSKFTVIVLLVIASIVLSGCSLFGKKDNQDPVKGKPVLEEINKIPIKDRPFISITPRSDGREVTLVVNQLEGSKSVEYELEYQAGTLLQGAFGNIDFSQDDPPVSRKILLGSCSAGGKCSYHQDVNGGTILLRFKNSKTTSLKGEWNFQVMKEQKGKFTSRDAKFTFEVPANSLSPQTIVIIAQTMGLPGPVDGEVIGGPYQVKPAKGVSLRAKDISLTMRTSEDAVNAKLLGWSEDGWVEYEAKPSGKMLEALVSGVTTFVAVRAQ